MSSALDRTALDLTALRIVNGAKDKQTIYLHGRDEIWRYDVASVAADNGSTVIKPNGINVLKPGRWILSIGGVSSAGDPRLRTAFRWTFPGNLNTQENDTFPMLFLDRATTIDTLDGQLRVASAGADAVGEIWKGNRADGILATKLGTVTITAGLLKPAAPIAVNPGIVVAKTEFLTAKVTGAGVDPNFGTTLTLEAFGS